MAVGRETKREDLRSRLIHSARKRVADHGLSALRARDVTRDAGCALGALYSAFSDLDELVIHVNAATLDMLERDLVRALEGEDDPAMQLRILARSYLRFAMDHRHLWGALFEHRLPAGGDVPEWHLARHMFLIQFIARPLAVLDPSMREEDLRIRALTLFSAVHGIVSISLEGRFIGIPRDRLEGELDDLLTVITAGAVANRPA